MQTLRKQPEHLPIGDPCQRCYLPARVHRKRAPRKRNNVQKPLNLLESKLYLGIDGEGQGKANHIYTYLAASNKDGSQTWSVENLAGLTTFDCLCFIASLPSDAMISSYFFGYDLTKILADLDSEKLYMLWRPNLRNRTDENGFKGPKPIEWNGFSINMRGSKFSVYHPATQKRVTLWDIGKFYQSKFTEALKLWKVGDEKSLEEMGEMKDQRSKFDELSFDEVKSYCLSECRHLAKLVEKLCDAHEKVDLKLKSFYGAGSSASAMLKKMKVKDCMADVPSEMLEAVSCAFFGGRFENSVVGKIEGPIYGADIASAYPYQTYFLPCLKHGKWEKTKKRSDIDKASHALIRYVLKTPNLLESKSWGPFPFRDKHGSICFPIESGGGWVWREEYLQGERIWENVQFKEAWIYHVDCNCHPFRQISEYYNERCRIGKSGPGIVLKLGCNSVYGKMAQSIGDGPFNNWIWAGMVTSGCRAQLLEYMGLHSDRRNVLMIATDGVQSLEKIECPIPKDTGTADSPKVALGAWETEITEKGMFFARPGIYFPLNPTKAEIKKIRGRGLGKAVVLENASKILEEWEKHGIGHTVHIKNMSRFCGAKTSISRSGKPGRYTYKRAYALPGFDLRSYGQWIKQPITVSFDPLPKRERVMSDGRTLETRTMKGKTSVPYSKVLVSEEAKMMQAREIVMDEQPDGHWVSYD